MDKFLKQLACCKATTNGDGSVSYAFSLDVLVPNLISAGAGFCLGFFLVADMIPGIKPNGGK